MGWKEASMEEQKNEFIKEVLSPMGYHQIQPEDCGALTSAPLIIDSAQNVYGYMNYAIMSFLEELRDGNTVIWQKG